jgi:hypothetical protein
VLTIDSVERNAQQSPLLRLPAEIRNMIFIFALSDNIISPTLWHADSDPDPEHTSTVSRSVTGNRPPLHRFSLLRVSRQIYAETAILPYHLSTFRFYDSSDCLL